MSDNTKIGGLECHFKWNPQDRDAEAELSKLVLSQLCVLDEFPDILPLKHNLVGYLYSRLDAPDYVKALTHFDKVIDLATYLQKEDVKFEEYVGHEYVAKANKIHVLSFFPEKQSEIAQLLASLPEYESLPDKSVAAIIGNRGFAFSHFGINNYSGSVSAYQDALKLDSKNYLWRTGVAFAAGRLRRIEEGIQAVGTGLEEENLRKAIKLSGEQRAMPIAMLAELLFNNSRDFNRKENSSGCKDPAMMEEAEKLFDKAYELDPHSPHVLKRCGKFVQMKRDKEKGMQMLKEACEKNLYSSQSWFRLGQAYRYAVPPNFAKAEECMNKAVTIGRRRNFFAESDLGWVRNKQDHTYDLITHFAAMKVHYPGDELRQQQIDTTIQDIRNYRARRQELNSRGQDRRGTRRPSRNYGNYGNREFHDRYDAAEVRESSDCRYQRSNRTRGNARGNRFVNRGRTSGHNRGRGDHNTQTFDRY